MKDFLDILVPKLFEVMDEHRIPQTRVARAAGLPRGTFSCWYNGINRVDPETAEHLLQVAQELAAQGVTRG